jgi:hypothetical protein
MFCTTCGHGDPGAVAPLNGSVLDYLIVNIPLSRSDEGVINPLRGNVTDRIQMTNLTQSSTNITEGIQNPDQIRN